MHRTLTLKPSDNYQAKPSWKFIFNALHPGISAIEKIKELVRLKRIFKAVQGNHLSDLKKEKPHPVELIYLPMDKTGKTALLHAQQQGNQSLLNFIFKLAIPVPSEDDDNDLIANKLLWTVDQLPNEFFTLPATYLPPLHTLYSKQAKLKWAITTRQPLSECLALMPKLEWENDEAFKRCSYEDILGVAAQAGNQEIVTLITNAWNERAVKTYAGRYEVAMENAAHFNHIDIFKYLLTIVKSLPNTDLNYSTLRRIQRVAVQVGIKNNCFPLLKAVENFLVYFYDDKEMADHPIKMAEKYHHTNIVKYLLALNPKWKTVMTLDGSYPIIDAFLRHDLDTVKCLIPYMHVGIFQRIMQKCSQLEVISFLRLIPKANEEAVDDESDNQIIFGLKDQLFALNAACREGKLNLVKYLFNRNPDLLNMKNSENQTSIKISLANGHLAVSQYLLKCKAKIDKEDERIYRLMGYIANRSKDKRDYFYKITFFGRVLTSFGGCSRDDKLSAAKKFLSQFTYPGKIQSYTQSEMDALNEGRLGKIKNY